MQTQQILDMSCCYQLQQQSYHNENTNIHMFTILYVCYVDILFPLIKTIPIMFERVSTHYQTLLNNLQTLPENSILCNFEMKDAWINTKTQENWFRLLMQLIISDLGWLTLFCIICRTQIRRSCLQRHFLPTLSLIINKKIKKKKEKNSKHFCKH